MNAIINKYVIRGYLFFSSYYNILTKHEDDEKAKDLVRQQKLIEDNVNYYVAFDYLMKRYYICYKNIMMIDIDVINIIKEHKVLPETCLMGIESHAVDTNQAFIVYLSQKGYHVFCISSYKLYTDPDVINEQLSLRCDFMYSKYCSYRGFCVRLNKKKDEVAFDNDTKLYKFLKIIGNSKFINDDILKLVEYHIELSDTFINE